MMPFPIMQPSRPLPAVRPFLAILSALALHAPLPCPGEPATTPAPLDLDAAPDIPPWLASDLDGALEPDPATRSALEEMQELDSLADHLANATPTHPQIPFEMALEHAGRAIHLAHFQALLSTALEAERQALAIKAELAAAEALSQSHPEVALDPTEVTMLHRELARATAKAQIFHHAAASCRERLGDMTP